MIYILLPAYNEEISIAPLFDKLNLFFRETLNKKYQIIICDDGSTDNTVQEINKYKDKYPVELIRHKINRGTG